MCCRCSKIGAESDGEDSIGGESDMSNDSDDTDEEQICYLIYNE